MFCAVFSYEVRDPVAFEQMYGPDGEWARFFSRGPGYLGTELLASGEGRYLLIDRWFSRAAYETFLAANHAEYERRSGAGEGLYVREERIGTFESPPTRGLHLRILPGRFAVCRLDPAAALPDAFWSVTRTDDELSVICADDAVPAAARVERGWRGLQVA